MSNRIFAVVWVILAIVGLAALLGHRSEDAFFVHHYSFRYFIFICLYFVASAALLLTLLKSRFLTRAFVVIELLVLAAIIVFYLQARAHVGPGVQSILVLQGLVLIGWKFPGWWTRIAASGPSGGQSPAPDKATGFFAANKYLILAVLLTLALDLCFYVGFNGAGDDGSYLASAHYYSTLQQGLSLQDGKAFLPDGRFAFNMAGLRFTLTIPAAFIYWLTAGSVFAICLYFIAYHLGLTITTYLLGTLLHSRIVGLAAAFLAAVCPLFFFFAGNLLPDLAVTFWALISALLLFHFQKRRASLRQGQNFGLLFAAGLFLGFSYLANQAGLIMIVPSAILIAFSSRRLVSLETVRHGLYFCLGLIAVIAIEAGLIYWIFGKFALRYQLGFNEHAEQNLLKFIGRQGILPHQRFATAYELMTRYLHPVVIWLYVGAFVFYLFKKGSNFFLWFFCAWPLVFYTLGSTGLGAYLPPPVTPRKYSLFFAPASILLAFSIWSITPYLAGKAASWAASAPRKAIALLAVPVLIVALLNIATNAPSAGNLVNADKVRSLVGAVEEVEGRYPFMPIVLPPVYATLKGPLFLNRKQDDMVFLGIRGPKDLRLEPPFVLLGSLADHHYGRPDILSAVREDLRPTVRMRLVDIVYPQPNRWYDISNAIGSLFCLPERSRHPYPRPQRNGTYVVLVESSAGARDEGIIFSTSRERFLLSEVRGGKGCQVMPYQTGYILSWPGGRPLGEICLDSSFGRPETAPYSFLSSFSPRRGRFVLRAGLDNLTKNNNRGAFEARLFLYGGGRLVASSQKKVDRLDQGRNFVELAVTTQEAVDKFRVILCLAPQKNEPGRIYLDEMELAHTGLQGD